MAYFPMFVELEGRPCLIVGGGAVALRKARKLLPYGPCLTVVAQSFVPELEALEGAALCRRAFRPRDVEGQALVVAATGDGALNREIAALCRARRIPVNAVDDKDNCTFLFPALVRRGPLSIGISTGGASPTAAVYVKEKIEAALPGGDGWNGILEYLAARRAPVRASVPDETARGAAVRGAIRRMYGKGKAAGAGRIRRAGGADGKRGAGECIKRALSIWWARAAAAPTSSRCGGCVCCKAATRWFTTTSSIRPCWRRPRTRSSIPQASGAAGIPCRKARSTACWCGWAKAERPSCA